MQSEINMVKRDAAWSDEPDPSLNRDQVSAQFHRVIARDDDLRCA